ncbi:PH-like domain-containing protein [Arthrobacter pityocampae]|uniref:PH-like domain-containing protein n=1 Tax=Arthrobacter pityocampae TaxID=547334 RepID=UPI00373555C6
MEYLGWVVATVAIIAVIVALMGLGWRNRLRRQADVPAPPAPPAGLGPVLYEAEGQYVATTTAGDWLDRIAVHGLGLRGNAVASVHPEGVLLSRTGAPDVFVPRGDLTSVQLAGGMTGKFVEKEGLVILTWRLGDLGVDTGFRTRHAAHKAQLVAAIAALVPDRPAHPGTGRSHGAGPTESTDPIPDRTPPTPEGREQL